MENEYELIKKYLKGEESSLEMLIKHYFQPIYNFVYRIIGNKNDVNDVAQEVFVKMWKNLKRYDKNRSFKIWIFTIARNTAFDWLKKKKIPVFSDFEENQENALFEIADKELIFPEELIAKAEEKKILEDAINNLPPIYRTVLFLRLKENFTFEEIAQILNESLNTIKSRYSRGVITLRKFLNK